MDTVQRYDIVVHSVASIAAQFCGLPLHIISLILSTLQLITYFLRTVFGYSGISYGGTSNNPFQVIYQGKGCGLGLWLCVSTYIIKLLLKICQSIPLDDTISTTNKKLAALVFVNDTDVPVKGESKE